MRLAFLPGLALALLVLVAACTTPPTAQELKSAHYGAYPSDYRSTLEPLMESRHQQLGDPFQLISMSKPRKDWMGDSGSRAWGYAVVVVYQAPNPAVSAPSYTFREKFFFVNRKVIAATNITNLGDVFGSAVNNNVDSATQQLGSDDSGDDSSGSGDSATTHTAKTAKKKKN